MIQNEVFRTRKVENVLALFFVKLSNKKNTVQIIRRSKPVSQSVNQSIEGKEKVKEGIASEYRSNAAEFLVFSLALR